jgi:hypothetical protein
MLDVMLQCEESTKAASLSRTYQEAVLARRKLYFTNTRMFIECEQGTFHEDEFHNTAKSNHLIRPHRTTRLRLSSYDSDFVTYVDHVENYSSRFLSYHSDVYAAFSGILTLLFGSDSLHYGLPLEHFDCALHWYLEQSNEDVISLERRSETNSPSWSWYSRWRPPSRIKHAAYNFAGTLSVWYKSDVTGNMLLALNEQCESEIRTDWQFYMFIAYEAGCVMGSLSLAPAQEIDLDIGQQSRKYWQDYTRFYQQVGEFVMGVSPAVQHIMQKTPNAILGRLQSTFFDLDADPRYKLLGILDREGATVGYMLGFYPEIMKRWESQNAWGIKADRLFEFIGTMLRVQEYLLGHTSKDPLD